MRRFIATAGVLAAFSLAGIALAQTSEGITEAQTAALADLSSVYGAPVVRLDQAKAICNEEQYLTDCAEIGKKHELFSSDRAKQVNALLSELKGEAVEKLKQCEDVACLVDVATSIAGRLNVTSPSIAKAVELTPQKVKEKQSIVETAKSLGVDMEACRTMDPETASVELLRGCARLAKHENVQKYIPQETRERVKEADAAIELKESLESGAVACGDNTLEGCGTFCLAPSAEARVQGAAAIPGVCRDIAKRFFGEKGIEELERAYTTVRETFDTFAERAKYTAFVTDDGRTLTDPAAIGSYMEEAGGRGDVDAVTSGMGFLQAKGFVTAQDRDFAITMVKNIKERGTPINFDACRTDPSRCAGIVPEEDRGQFAAMAEVEKVVRGEMSARGIADPSRCSSDAAVGSSCLEAARAALPQIERLAETSPEARMFAADLRQKIRFGEAGIEARSRVEQEFKTTGDFSMGNVRFGSIGELESFCRTNPQQCLTETARDGIFSKDVAAEKYERVIETSYNIENTRDVFRPSDASFNKEEALKQFKSWLDNPQGPPPSPNFGQSQYQQYPPQYSQYPRSQVDQNRCAYTMVYQPPCKSGEYRQESVNELGCTVLGACIPFDTKTEPPRLDGKSLCPALPTVNSCAAGEEKFLSYSSPECGTYYGCRAVKEVVRGITFPYTFGNGKRMNSFEEARTYCMQATVEQGVAGECEAKFGIYPPAPEPIGNKSCEQRYGNSWKAVDSSGNCLNTGMTEYYDPGGVLRRCSTNPVYGCSSPSPVPIPPSSGQREQVWNSYGLRSWVRADANASRIESLKAACAKVQSSQANVWMPGAGESSNENFGMPDSAKCTKAASCASGQYFDGTTCSTAQTQTSCSSGQYWDGSACVTSTGGTGSMYRCTYPHAYFNTDYKEFTAFCERDYVNCKRVDTNASIGTTGLTLGAPSSCESGWTSGSNTTCPSGKYWDGSACVTSTATSGTSCPSGQWWNGTSCTSSTSGTDYASAQQGCATSGGTWDSSANYCRMPVPSQITTTGSCSSELVGLLGSGCHSMGSSWFNSEMTQYVLSGGSTVRSCTTENVPGCSGGTAQTQTSCSSGQYWDGSACVTSTATSGTSCPSGQWWNGTSCTSSTSGTDYASAQQGCATSGGTWDSSANYCRMPTTITSCGTGQYWNGSSCVTTSSSDTVPTDTSSWQQSCASAGGTWESSSNYCRMPTTSTYTAPSTETYTAPSPTETYTPPAETVSPPPAETVPPPATTESAPISYLFCPDGHDWNGAYCTLSPRSPFERYTASAWTALRALVGL